MAGGEKAALEALTPLVYEELRRVAERYMRRESSAQTLQATALVHEAYERVATVELRTARRLRSCGRAAGELGVILDELEP